MAFDFSESEDTKLLRETVRRFAESEVAKVASHADQTESFPLELTKAMGELGLFGMVVGEAYGGHGLDYHTYIVAVEELARVDGSARSHCCSS